MQCSGGERQRVALARALAYDPEILFFDEPLSAIDYKLRKTLEKELKDIHRETHKTFIYITHSLEEAMVMSDRIGVMRAGKLVQVGTPNEIYTAPEIEIRLRVHGRREHHLRVTRRRERCAPRGGSRRDVPRPAFARRPDRGASRDPAGIPALPRRAVGGREQPRRAGSTTNTRSARASSTRCASASRCSSSRSFASRPMPASSTTIVTHRLGRARFHPGERLMANGSARFGPGGRAALPFGVLFLVGFVAPLVAVIVFSFMPPRTFSIWQAPTLENYRTIFEGTNYISFLWSLGARRRSPS